jgi:Transglutaminase-like superfamily
VQAQPSRATPPVLLSAPMTVSQHPNGMRHVRDTIRKMAALAREAQQTYEIRNLATRIVHDVPSHQRVGELRAIYQWVRDTIRYRFDPLGLEWVQAPSRTVTERAGDCDDLATLIAALVGALGHRWRFRTVGDSPTAQRHVQVQAWTGKQWLDLDPVLEPTQPTTAPRTDPGTFAASAMGAEHLWDSEGNMLSGPTSARDRELWSIVPYFQPAPPWPPYGGTQPPTPGKFPRIDTRYRSPDAPGYQGGQSLAQVYHLPRNSVLSLPGAQLEGLGRRRHKFGRRFRRLAKKIGKGFAASLDPTGASAAALLAKRRKRKKKHHHHVRAHHRLSGPTTPGERELWHWIPYSPITNGPAPNGEGMLLSYPPGHVQALSGLGALAEDTLVPWDVDVLDGLGRRRRLRGFVRKLKKVGKKIARGVKKVVKNPVFKALANTVASFIPGAGQALQVAKTVATGVKLAKGAAHAVKRIKKGVRRAKHLVHRAKHLVHHEKAMLKALKKRGLKPLHVRPVARLNAANAKKAIAAKAAQARVTALHAAVPTKVDPNAWKKPHQNLQKKYPSNARQLYDAKAGLFRVFVPTVGLTAGAIASMRRRGGHARPKRRLSGLGAVRPTISFSLGLGAVQSSPQAARSPALIAAAKKAVSAINTFARNHANKPPAIALPAITSFQKAEKNLTVDGLFGTNTAAALTWYLQGTGVKVPAYAPGLRTALTWSPPLATLPASAPTPQPALPKAPAKKPAPAPAPDASFPAPGGYTEIGAESANPGLTPAGYTASGAPPAPAVPGTPVQPGAPTGGAPKPPVAAVATSMPDESIPGTAALVPTSSAKPRVVVDVWGPHLEPPDATPQAAPQAAQLPPLTPVASELPSLPVLPGPVPAIPITPSPAPSSGSGEIVMWASLIYLWAQGRGRRRAA